jgi:putative membrane protein
MLLLGIWQHVEFMRGLRRQRAALVRAGLVHDDEPFPYSMTLVLAALLLLVGFVAIVSMLARVQPFH